MSVHGTQTRCFARQQVALLGFAKRSRRLHGRAFNVNVSLSVGMSHLMGSYVLEVVDGIVTTRSVPPRKVEVEDDVSVDQPVLAVDPANHDSQHAWFFDEPEHDLVLAVGTVKVNPVGATVSVLPHHHPVRKSLLKLVDSVPHRVHDELSRNTVTVRRVHDPLHRRRPPRPCRERNTARSSCRCGNRVHGDGCAALPEIMRVQHVSISVNSLSCTFGGSRHSCKPQIVHSRVHLHPVLFDANTRSSRFWRLREPTHAHVRTFRSWGRKSRRGGGSRRGNGRRWSVCNGDPNHNNPEDQTTQTEPPPKPSIVAGGVVSIVRPPTLLIRHEFAPRWCGRKRRRRSRIHAFPPLSRVHRLIRDTDYVK